MGRKHSGKRRNCWLQAISPFPTVFSKDWYNRHMKARACLGKGKAGTVETKDQHKYVSCGVNMTEIMLICFFVCFEG